MSSTNQPEMEREYRDLRENMTLLQASDPRASPLEKTSLNRMYMSGLNSSVSFLDQESSMDFIVVKEKESASLACETPSSPEISGSKRQYFEGLNLLTTEQPESEHQSPALALTDESTPSQTPSQMTRCTNKQDLQPNWTQEQVLMKQRCEESEEIPAVVVTQPEESDEQEGPEEDTRSIAASSVMSLFHRIQMDPIEREWWRCAALGKTSALYMLLQQDNTLVSRKTALHWAAKQGRAEMVDMMVRSGADVNHRAGYTPLHLASLHGHDNIIQLLINNYNAKANIRDYHGKMAAHYWNDNMDIFNKNGSHSAGRWSRGRRGQCYAQLSALLSRSRSHGNISMEMCASPLSRTSQSPSP